MRKLSADIIYTGKEKIENGVIIIDNNNTIVEVLSDVTELEDIEHFSGSLCPGFVNTHCHLELSHMKGKVSEGKGLVEFIKELQTQRDEPTENEIQRAIEHAEQEMIANGIVAVGDISNGKDSFLQKQKRNIYYHTFIELYGFLDAQAETSFSNGLKLLEQIEHSSIVPHSPYSVAPKLFEYIKEWSTSSRAINSMHNQETQGESDLFLNGTGSIMELFSWFGLDTSFWKPSGKTPLISTLPLLNPNSPTLLVHNTMSSAEDIQQAEAKLNAVYWCLCPNANWYIERKQPNYNLFESKTENVTIGTDSLTSNWSLSILDELKRINKHAPNIETNQLIRWATNNGAMALQIDNQFGALEKGKAPGIVHLSTPDINPTTTASRIL